LARYRYNVKVVLVLAMVAASGLSAPLGQAFAQSATTFTLTATAPEQGAVGTISGASANNLMTVNSQTSGTPELPNLLDGYAVRPPWQVAGVDYYVGVPAGTVLQDPTNPANLPAGVIVDSTDQLILITGNNVTLDGFNFAIDGGNWAVYITGSNATIENSVFAVGGITDVGNTLTVLNSTFDGQGIGGGIGAIGNGITTIEYNYFLNMEQQGPYIGPAGTGTLIFAYNLEVAVGFGAGTHMNFDQTQPTSTGTLTNSVFAYNTFYQPQTASENNSGYIAAYPGDGVEVAPNFGTVTNTTISNNVIIAQGGGAGKAGTGAVVSYLMYIVGNPAGSSVPVVDGVNVNNNYMDPSGAYGAFYPISGTDINLSNNITLVPGPSNLTLVAAISGNGQVMSTPANINCSAGSSPCAANFPTGMQVALTASAASGSSFAGWSGGGCSGTGTCVITLTANTTVTATFDPTVTLTVAEAGTGTGQVTSSPAGINCSASSNQCAAPFAMGSQVTLTASASAGSSFTGWSGDGCTGTGTCQVTLATNTTVTASSKKKPATKMLSVALTGGGSGTVTSSPSGINCGATCAASFDTGTQIALTAAPASDSTFTGWSGGGCSGNDSCALTLDAATTVTASFVANTAGNLTLVAAVLPTSRSVEIGATPTAFATMINAGPADATTCTIAPATSIPADFLFQTTNPATNAVTGTPNTPVDIAAGQAGTFVIAFTPTAAFPPTNVAFTFTCANAPAPAASITGVNTFNLSASTQPVPDIVALAASGDPGYVDIPGATGTGVFAVATVNLGIDATITASANTGAANLPVTLLVCQTDPTSGTCLAAPSASVATDIPPNATPTFGIFVTGGSAVADMPGINRIFVTFTDSGGVLRGETSVAVRTQ
jgi:hypothetical protein